VSPLALVVEDEPLVARITCAYLEEAGLSCVTAGSAAAALEVLEAGYVPDLLVLDVRLPDLPGTDLALRIHERYPGIRIPVLFVSGWAEAINAATQLERLRWSFLPKPFSPEAMADAARRLLAGS
jgi:CheY-like chemotaxis protein